MSYLQLSSCTDISIYYFISVGTPVIQGPSKVIFRPNEGPVELVCERNTTAGSTLWRLNGSDALTPAALVMRFSGHVTNGVDIQIVNATNNTEYICVSNVDRVGETDSEPVYLYVAGTYVRMLYHYPTCMIMLCMCSLF